MSRLLYLQMLGALTDFLLKYQYNELLPILVVLALNEW